MMRIDKKLLYLKHFHFKKYSFIFLKWKPSGKEDILFIFFFAENKMELNLQVSPEREKATNLRKSLRKCLFVHSWAINLYYVQCTYVITIGEKTIKGYSRFLRHEWRSFWRAFSMSSLSSPRVCVLSSLLGQESDSWNVPSPGDPA